MINKISEEVCHISDLIILQIFFTKNTQVFYSVQKYQHFRTDCFNICTSPGLPPRIFKWCLPVLNKVLTCTLHFKLCPEQPSSWYNTSWIPTGHCSLRLDCNYHVNILCSDMQICTHVSCIILSSLWNVDLCSMFWEFLMKPDIKLSLTQDNHNYLTLNIKVNHFLCF